MSLLPNQGDIIWLDFTPQSGHEQKGRRPAIVVSNGFYNQHTGLTLVCPVTSSKRNYPLHVEMNGCRLVSGSIMVEQVRAVDYTARNAEFIEKAPKELLNEVLSRLYACL